MNEQDALAVKALKKAMNLISTPSEWLHDGRFDAVNSEGEATNWWESNVHRMNFGTAVARIVRTNANGLEPFARMPPYANKMWRTLDKCTPMRSFSPEQGVTFIEYEYQESVTYADMVSVMKKAIKMLEETP